MILLTNGDPYMVTPSAMYSVIIKSHIAPLGGPFRYLLYVNFFCTIIVGMATMFRPVSKVFPFTTNLSTPNTIELKILHRAGF